MSDRRDEMDQVLWELAGRWRSVAPAAPPLDEAIERAVRRTHRRRMWPHRHRTALAAACAVAVVGGVVALAAALTPSHPAHRPIAPATRSGPHAPTPSPTPHRTPGTLTAAQIASVVHARHPYLTAHCRGAVGVEPGVVRASVEGRQFLIVSGDCDGETTGSPTDFGVYARRGSGLTQLYLLDTGRPVNVDGAIVTPSFVTARGDRATIHYGGFTGSGPVCCPSRSYHRHARLTVHAVSRGPLVRDHDVRILGPGPVTSTTTATQEGRHTMAPACPPTSRGGTWVPARPSAALAPARRLVPITPPTAARVCRYGTGTPEARTGQRVITSGLSEIPRMLAWAAPKLPGQQAYCAYGLAGVPDYLIGLRYPRGTLWVSAVSCDGNSNGRFTTLWPYPTGAGEAYASGTWPAPVAPACGEDPRLGQQHVLVPAGAIALTVCQQHHAPVHVTDRAKVTRLGMAIDKLATRDSTQGCQPDSSGGGAGLRTLAFSYPVGPPAVLRYTPHCSPELDASTLQGLDSAHRVAALIASLPDQPGR